MGAQTPFNRCCSTAPIAVSDASTGCMLIHVSAIAEGCVTILIVTLQSRVATCRMDRTSTTLSLTGSHLASESIK